MSPLALPWNCRGGEGQGRGGKGRGKKGRRGGAREVCIAYNVLCMYYYAICIVIVCINYLKRPEWLGTDMTRLSFAPAKNGQLFFQRFGSMQQPSSGNDDKEKRSCIQRGDGDSRIIYCHNDETGG